MKNLRDRISVHAAKVDKHEELEAALAGVFSQEVQQSRERFESLVQQVIKPAFDEFKNVMRGIGRDPVIVTHLSHGPGQSISLTLLDRYLSFGAGKTLKLVNPKDDITQQPKAKFYEISSSISLINVRQKVDSDPAPITTKVTYADINSLFLENELAAFFERAYPTPI